MRVPPLLLLVLALLLAGCDSPLLSSLAPSNPPSPSLCDELAQQEEDPQNLSFETIAREESGDAQLWPESEPGLRILTASQEISSVAPYLQEKTVADLHEVDYTSSLIAAIFITQPEGGWGLCNH